MADADAGAKPGSGMDEREPAAGPQRAVRIVAIRSSGGGDGGPVLGGIGAREGEGNLPQRSRGRGGARGGGSEPLQMAYCPSKRVPPKKPRHSELAKTL